MRKLISACLLLLPLALCAQEDGQEKASFRSQLSYKLAYNGNLFLKNGLTFGSEYLWKEHNKPKERRGKQKSITHALIVHGNVGFSTNFTTQTDAGAFSYYGLIWRRTNPAGRQFSVELNPLGYYRSFLPETYAVNGDNVEKVFLPGRSYYAPSFTAGIGREIKGKKRSAWFLNIKLMYRTPYNSGALPSLSLQYGYRFGSKKNKP